MSAIEIPGYKIIKTLGVGGQATVYLAIQQGFDRKVALKVMSPALAADPTFGERFIREAKIVAKLAHPRIVTVYDVGESGSFYYLAMEYMRGGDLKAQIAKGVKTKEALIIIAKLAQALGFAHKKGYVHRDVKSENILFNEDGQPVLTDFGIAKASNSSTQMTQTGKLIGTPEYMSPEQCRGKKLDGRSDIYSLGIILFEMITRKVPYSGSDSVSVCILHVTKEIPQLPARLNHFQWIIDKMLSKNPKDRFQTGKELSDVIKEYLRNGGHSTSKTIETKKIAKAAKKTEVRSERRDDFNNESFELNDNFHVDQRINVMPETKSRVPMMATIFILIIAIGAGFALKDQWLPKVQAMLSSSSERNISNINLPTKPSETESRLDENTDGQFRDDGLATSKKGDANTQENTSHDSKVATRSSVAENKINPQATEKLSAIDGDDVDKINQLIQQADTLAQYSPHELTDIKQALDHLITAKSLSPDNQSVLRIKNNIIQIALEESISSAQKNQFEQAKDWLKLVESSDGDNERLEVTKQAVADLKIEYDNNVIQREADAKKIEEALAKAETAVSENRLGTPDKNNAVYYYQSVLKLDDANAIAKQGIETVANKYRTLIDRSIASNKFQRAKKQLNILRNISATDTDFSSIETKMSEAKKRFSKQLEEKKRVAAIAEKKRKAEVARQAKLSDPLLQMQLQSKLQAAKSLAEIEQLVEPIGDNALQKYRAVLEIDHLDPTAIEGIKEIEKTIIDNIEVAISNNILAVVQQWVPKLEMFDPKHAKLANYKVKLDEMVVSSQLESSNNGQSNNEPSENDLPLENKNNPIMTTADDTQEESELPASEQPTPTP